MLKKDWTQADGLGALVVVPTRELAHQIFDVINKVGFKHYFSVGLLIGGTDVRDQLKRLYAINIVICTPGRLLQHLEENPNFYVDQLQMLIVDEADRILDMGFKAQVTTDSLFRYCPFRWTRFSSTSPRTGRLSCFLQPRPASLRIWCVFRSKIPCSSTPTNILRTQHRTS